MTITALFPFICLFAYNPTPPSGSIYNYQADISYQNTFAQPVIRGTSSVAYSTINVVYDFDLFFDDANSYRLDLNTLTVDWYAYTYDNNYYVDHWHLVHTFNISYTYDTISQFKPLLRLATDYEDDLFIIGIFNGLNFNVDNLIHSYHFDADIDIGISDSYAITFDMSNFQTSLDTFLNGYGDLSDEYNNGYDVGYTNGYTTGYTTGQTDGYTQGFNAGISVDDTAVIIFNGILNIALVPINFFLAIFNFEILGINMSALVTSILSICLIIIVVRFVTGKKQGGD